MFSKAAPLLRAAPRIQHVRRMGHGVPAHWKPMRQICEENKNHMNCMPVPEGSWQEAYSKQNGKWNMMLVLSVISFFATFGLLYKTDCIYVHGAPPMYNCKK